MSELKTLGSEQDSDNTEDAAKRTRLRSALSNRFGISGEDLKYILSACEKIPSPENSDIDSHFSNIFEDFTSIYHCYTLKDEDKVIPDAAVIYDRVIKVVAIITEGSKLELDRVDSIIRRCIDNGRKAALNKPSSFEYVRFDNIDPSSRSHDTEILFLGHDKLCDGQSHSNLGKLEKYFKEHPDDLSMLESKYDKDPADLVKKEFNGKEVKSASTTQEKPTNLDIIKPKEIYEEISKTVFGQEQAKRSLSVILYEHLLRQKDGCRGRDIPKTNALLVGPSGCGKTLIAKTMAEVAKIPFVRIDASSLVVRGYRGGMHIEQIIDILLSAANGHISLASRGIVFLDEIDKLATIDNDWEGATSQVQSELLSIIDGCDFFYEDDHGEYARTKFSFKDVLFIFGGAFEKKYSMIENSRDIVSFGLIPELANRMGTIIKMDQSSPNVLIQMIRPAVEEYSAILNLSKDEQTLYTELLSSIVKADKELVKMGGRCIGPLVRKFFEDRLFEL